MRLSTIFKTGPWRGLSALLLVLLSAGSSFALDHNRSLTQYVHRIWQLPQGLPDATVTSITQTADGYIWLGTETGLVRFDGVRFSRLEDITSTPLKRAWIRSILQGPGHEILVGTNDAGVFRLDNGTAVANLQNVEAPRAAVQCLVADSHDDLWACTASGLVRADDKEHTIVYGQAQGLPSNNIRAACEDPAGMLWVGGDGNRLAYWTGSAFASRVLESLPVYGSVRALLCAPDGGLWVGTTSGLIHIENGKEHLLTVKDGLADNWIYCLMQDHDGVLWAGTKNGFSRLRSNVFESYRTEDGLSQSTVYALYEDREGSLWVGTKHGLNQFLDGRTIPYSVSEGLPTNNVGPVLQDHTGTIWVGTLGSGLCRFDGHRFSVFNTKKGLAGDYVYALAEDSDGLWVGTNNGLAEIRDGHVARTLTKAQGLPENHIQSLFRDHAGVLWISTPSGVAMYSNGSVSRPKESAGPSQALLLGGGEDKEGNFLEATESGLKIYRDHQLQDFQPQEPALRQIDTFYVDDDGLLWMGTQGSGLRLLKDGKVFSYFMRDGLFDNEIYGIVGDSQDRLWMASSKGIFSVYRADLRKFAAGEISKVVSTPYSPLDGLRTIECKGGVQPAVWKAQDGRLWFSTIRGLLVIDPARLQHSAPAPQVVIENVLVNGQDKTADQINELAPGRKDVEFRYTALSYLAPGLTTFRYTLDGYDPSWTDAGNRRVAYYTNLPPGQYHFHVVACNLDGVCTESPSPLGFRLISPYYLRLWFLPLCAVVLILAIWLAWRWRVQSLRQHFEIVLAERGRIARELHDTLIQGFSGITMGMQAVSTGLPESEERSHLSELIHDAASCLRQARQSIAGLRGERHLDEDLHVAIAKAAREITRTRNVELKLNLEPSPANVPSEVNHNILRIAKEAITNSIQHAEARTIAVDLHFPHESVQLSVKDDGRGLNENDAAVPAGHYGLTGMKERAKEIGADFRLISKPLQGTTISVLWKRAGEKPLAI